MDKVARAGWLIINVGERVIVAPDPKVPQNGWQHPGVEIGDFGVVTGVSGTGDERSWTVKTDSGERFVAWHWEIGRPDDPEWLEYLKEVEVEAIQNG
jgi:hypothetical protein